MKEKFKVGDLCRILTEEASFASFALKTLYGKGLFLVLDPLDYYMGIPKVRVLCQRTGNRAHLSEDILEKVS